MKHINRTFSILLHPLLIPVYGILILFSAFPEIFDYLAYPKSQILIRIIVNMVLFPLFAMFLLSALGFVKNIGLKGQKDRTAALLLILFFYIWTAVSFWLDQYTSKLVIMWVLGITIATVLAFLANILIAKLSLHTLAMGVFTGFMLSILPLSLFNLEWLLLLVILISGITGTIAIIHYQHSNSEVYGAYMLGLFSQLIALQMVLNF